MPTMANIGEAAGIAAAFAIKENQQVTATNGHLLKQYLIDNKIIGDQ
jgi:hypothetical protein